MLQHPSKYHHPNPVSHFLALHNSQAAHHNAQLHAHSLPTAGPAASTAAANVHNQFHQQQQAIMAASHHHQQQQQQQQHLSNSPHAYTHLIDAAAAAANVTSLDTGKSFTIAAILGLQKSAIESTRKEYNSVINLSLHGGGGSGSQLLSASHEMLKAENMLTSNGGGSGNKINNFNCDSNAALVQRYSSVSSSFAAAASVSHQQHQQQQQPHQALATSHAGRANSFAAAAAVAAAAAAAAATAAANGGGAPTALQSLQQLHQHHAQQSSLSFQRDKLKSENSSKKTSLKNKRVRTIFTPEQLERLEAEFERQQYMVGPERLYLAHTLQLTEAQVKVWFQNRRIKWRKHHLEITQQRLAMLRQTQLPATCATAAATAAAAATAVGGVGVGVVVAPPPSSPSCEAESEEIKHNDMDLGQLSGGASGNASESDLSICNDSMDADSVMDGGDDT